MKVIKFGGSSLANATQLRKVFNIVKSDSSRKIVVVSAPGKRSSDDEKVTDLLIQLATSHIEGNYDEEVLKKILVRYKEICDELELKPEVFELVRIHFKNLKERNDLSSEYLMDAYKASGEDLNARLIASYFNQEGLAAKYVGPREAKLWVSNTPGEARVLEESYHELEYLQLTNEVIVFPGFYGVTKEGKIVTFSRGGSDITGSILANAVNAEEYENFTDVDAIYVASPKIVHKPLPIDVLSYTEMRELSYAGFSVFHTEALLPSIKKGIPVHVCNTNNPEASGTYIMKGKVTSPNVISGIASSPGFVSIYVKKYLMNHEIGFLRKVLTIFEEEGISIEHIPTGIDDATIIIRGEDATDEQLESIVERFYAELDVDEASFTRGLCLIMLVGEGMVNMVGTTARVASTLARTQINIELYNQGVSEVSMMFGILDQYEKKAIRALYDEFFGEEKEYQVVE